MARREGWFPTLMVHRALLPGITMLALAAVGVARLRPGAMPDVLPVAGMIILFLQFPAYLCRLMGAPGTLEMDLGPLEITAEVPPRPPPATVRPTLDVDARTRRNVLLAVGLSLGLPALALAVYAVAWSTGQMLTPIPLVLTPTLAVLDLLRRP